MEIYELGTIPEELEAFAGGKAKGLNRLKKFGFDIPRGFVVMDAETEDDFLQAAYYYADRGYKSVAVRSSATAEDGAEFSSAGQYSTYLDVSGREAVITALRACVESLNSYTASKYASFFPQAKSAKMSVIVQEMVQAAAAGVCFTDNPVAHGEILLEAVRGRGEGLVSGAVQADSYRMNRSTLQGVNAEEAVRLNAGYLGRETAEQIAGSAMLAASKFGIELDTEWAIDGSGKLFWLQARPITVSEDVPIDELDGKPVYGTDIMTTCNIGEMLPGAVTPLTLSTSVYSIDLGMRRMLVISGSYKNYDAVPEGSCAVSFNNILFLNLSTIYKMGYSVIGANVESVGLSICGRLITDVPEQPFKKANVFVRLINAVKYFKFLLSSNKARKKLAVLADVFRIYEDKSAELLYNEIDGKLIALNESLWLHYITSAHSGAMSSALYVVLSKKYKDDEIKGLIAGVLEDIPDIESVDILRSLRAIARALIKENPAVKGYTAKELQEYCEHYCGRESDEALSCFLKRHGHRAVREAEMRSKSWHNDAEGLMEYLRTVIASGGEEPKKAEKSYETNYNKLLADNKGSLRGAIKYLVKQSRLGVRNREFSKSMSMKVLDVFKRAYASLGGILAESGALPDADLIYFLTHKEIGSLIRQKNAALVKLALQRRRLLPEQQECKYKDINVGKPEQIKLDTANLAAGAVIEGAAISRGVVTGRARIVKTVDDANKLQKGEIMVASFTDIGWSPYYCLVGGLVTEVGSVLSHGAVVAREYALPLVANAFNATAIIGTGDLINVNGNTGHVTILSRAGEAV
ncbi:MAG: hypothetical protein LBS99_07030 [Clostridiales bacterium]|jgi:pyruvate,water dikinase|nr:hypothetical protein [Clostridiales bacterium]